MLSVPGFANAKFRQPEREPGRLLIAGEALLRLGRGNTRVICGYVALRRGACLRVVPAGDSKTDGCWSGGKLAEIALAAARRECWHVVTAGGSKNAWCWSGGSWLESHWRLGGARVVNEWKL